MTSEWIYLVAFGLMMAFCCYHMMHMMMQGSDESERPEGVRSESRPSGPERVNAEATEEPAPNTNR